MIKLSIIGFIGQDASLRVVGEKTVTNFSVAVDTSYKNKEGVKIASTQWVECSYWRKNEDSNALAQYLKKGVCVHVFGTPDVSHFVSTDSKVVEVLKCSADSVELCGAKPKTE